MTITTLLIAALFYGMGLRDQALVFCGAAAAYAIEWVRGGMR